MPFNPDASFTYYGQEAAELSLRPAVDRPALSSIFAIREGIKGKMLVRFLERVGLITKLDPGCGPTGSPLKIGRSDKTWNPVDLLAHVVECWKDARGTAEEWLLKPGNEKYVLDDTTYGLTYAEVVANAIFEDLHRMAHFADKTAVAADFIASITLSNGEVLTAAQLVPFFKTFDGLWRNVEKGVASGKTKLIGIPANDPTGNQKFVFAQVDDEDDLFQEMYDAADPRLIAQPVANLQLLVTRSIFTGWVKMRERAKLELAYQAQADGVSLPTWRGIAIKPVDQWDEYIGAYFKPAALNGKKDRPHRAILTVKGNLQLGFDATPIDDNGGADLEIWSERNERTWNGRAQYVADSQIADDALVVAAY